MGGPGAGAGEGKRVKREEIVGKKLKGGQWRSGDGVAGGHGVREGEGMA